MRVQATKRVICRIALVICFVCMVTGGHEAIGEYGQRKPLIANRYSDSYFAPTPPTPKGCQDPNPITSYRYYWDSGYFTFQRRVVVAMVDLMGYLANIGATATVPFGATVAVYFVFDWAILRVMGYTTIHGQVLDNRKRLHSFSDRCADKVVGRWKKTTTPPIIPLSCRAPPPPSLDVC